MIAPAQLIGMKYRLGADPERHGKADCLSLTRHVLGTYGIQAPAGNRSWYRRLLRNDYSVFTEQLDCWGVQVQEPRLGAVALCKAEQGYGLGAYWERGCLVFLNKTVVWKPVTSLPIERFYFPLKQSFVTP